MPLLPSSIPQGLKRFVGLIIGNVVVLEQPAEGSGRGFRAYSFPWSYRILNQFMMGGLRLPILEFSMTFDITKDRSHPIGVYSGTAGGPIDGLTQTTIYRPSPSSADLDGGGGDGQSALNDIIGVIVTCKTVQMTDLSITAYDTHALHVI
ncbi:hypothetical protein QTP88_009064 [Uroleucon formosanum]